jgi:hypothetical protein
LIDEHESIVGSTLDLPSVKTELFKDFKGSLKSLGAWGGDFMLAATDQGTEYVQDYFSKKGLETVISYDDMIQYT